MISRAEAIDMFNSDDLIGIGMEADSVRRPKAQLAEVSTRLLNERCGSA